jgi:hypothetical protein
MKHVLHSEYPSLTWSFQSLIERSGGCDIGTNVIIKLINHNNICNELNIYRKIIIMAKSIYHNAINMYRTEDYWPKMGQKGVWS